MKGGFKPLKGGFEGSFEGGFEAFSAKAPLREGSRILPGASEHGVGKPLG